MKSAAIRLGEVVSISKGRKHDQVLSEPTHAARRFIQIDDLRNDNNLKYTEEKGVEVKANDIIIAWDGANAGTIGFGLEGNIGSTLARLRIERSDITSQYLGWLLRSKFRYLRDHCTGATIPHISKQVLEGIQVPVHPLSEQQKIAAILSQVNAAREKRKQANQLTEQFLQSTFLSLFGDPVKNEKGWDVVQFSDAVTIEKNTIQSEDIQPEELYIGLEHIEKDTGELIGFQKMLDAELKSTKFKFTEENILYGKLRPYLNKVCFPGFSGVCSTDILPIKAKGGIASKHFIGYLMKQPFFIEKATSMSNGANLPRISPKVLETFDIILPPLSLQQKFAGIVQQTEQLRNKQRQSEQELEQLFQSLLQRYFG